MVWKPIPIHIHVSVNYRLLRENHSGMETVSTSVFQVLAFGCVRTIVVWKQIMDGGKSARPMGCVRTIVVWKPLSNFFPAVSICIVA